MPASKIVQLLNFRRTEPTASDRREDARLHPYRRLALQLHHEAGSGKASRSVMVVSPDDAGTCAVLAANLACCMAEELGQEILLADATREGRLSAALTDAIPVGLNTYLSDTSMLLQDLILKTSFTDVLFLPCGTRGKGYAPDNSSVLVREAASRFNFLVVAAGSILDDPFALAGASSFGTILMLAVENETPTKKFSEATESLRMCGADNLRIALVERS